MDVLSNIGTGQTRPDVAVEALNFIFDVYSDCAFDYDTPVYVQGKFNNQLKQILPAFKSMVTNLLIVRWFHGTEYELFINRLKLRIDEKILI
jgi:hypothetical protein